MLLASYMAITDTKPWLVVSKGNKCEFQFFGFWRIGRALSYADGLVTYGRSAHVERAGELGVVYAGQQL